MSEERRRTAEELSIERFETGDIVEAEEERPEEERYFVTSSNMREHYEDTDQDFYEFDDPLEPIEETEAALEDPVSHEADVHEDEVPVLLYGWAFASHEMDFADLTGNLYFDIEDGEAVVRYELDSDIPAYSSGTSPEEIVTKAPRNEFEGEITAGIDSKIGKNDMAIVIEASHDPESRKDSLKLAEFLVDIEESLE